MYFYSGLLFLWSLIKWSIFSGSLIGELGRGLKELNPEKTLGEKSECNVMYWSSQLAM